MQIPTGVPSAKVHALPDSTSIQSLFVCLQIISRVELGMLDVNRVLWDTLRKRKTVPQPAKSGENAVSMNLLRGRETRLTIQCVVNIATLVSSWYQKETELMSLCVGNVRTVQKENMFPCNAELTGILNAWTAYLKKWAGGAKLVFITTGMCVCMATAPHRIIA